MKDEDDPARDFRFLVVDVPDVASNIQRLLRSDNIVITATDSVAACQQLTDLETKGTSVDVVLCRIDIDEMRGQSVFRAAQACAEPPLFIHMARLCDEGIEPIHGADGILIKPFTLEELDDLLFKAVVARSRKRTLQMLSDAFN